MMNNKNNLLDTNNILSIPLNHEVKAKFLSYAMSVIISRALPNVDDGLKPVHRRILYAMYQLRVVAEKPHKKSARIVGEVIGKFHPHGDAAVYEAMTKMIQDFATNHPLIDGHGNFGSVDGDSPAAMRYTEVRLHKLIQESLSDLPYNTVDFVPNYDESEKEPSVLPGIVPNLLLNGSTGIAVGMATSIPPHNLKEIVNSIIAQIDNPQITVRELVEQKFLKGPDFPTAGFLVNNQEQIIQILETGRGSYKLRAKHKIETDENDHTQIIIEEIPYQVNKSRLIKNIVELIKKKEINMIHDLRDESNRLGIRVVISLNKGAQTDLVLKKLFKHTDLQTTFSVNMLALHDKQPELMNWTTVIRYYIDHQINVIYRKTTFLLKQDQQKIELLLGIAQALKQIDTVIVFLKKTSNPSAALLGLQKLLSVNERQAKAILEMRLQRLTALEQNKVFDEIQVLKKQILNYENILAQPAKQKNILKEKLLHLQNKYAQPRKTQIIAQDEYENINDEDLIVHETVLICLTKNNYLKRVSFDLFRRQKRGGVGVKGMTLNENDEVTEVLLADTHDNLLFFTNYGKVYQLKAYKVPDLGRTAKGTPAQNLIGIESGKEFVRTIIRGKKSNNNDDGYLFFVTQKGLIKKTHLTHFDSINKNGKKAIKLRANDNLSFVFRLNEQAELLISKNDNKIVRFSTTNVPEYGRNSQGVIATRFVNPKLNHVIGASYALSGHNILSLTSDGKGKITDPKTYRETKRGAKGVNATQSQKKNKKLKLVASLSIRGDENLLIARSNGKFIISPLKGVRKTKSRTASGVRLVRLEPGITITAAAVLPDQLK